MNLSEGLSMISEVTSANKMRLDGILVRLRGQTPEKNASNPLGAQGVFAPLERAADSLQTVSRLIDELDALVGHDLKDTPKVGIAARPY